MLGDTVWTGGAGLIQGRRGEASMPGVRPGATVSAAGTAGSRE
jgi:hypothetical protein